MGYYRPSTEIIKIQAPTICFVEPYGFAMPSLQDRSL